MLGNARKCFKEEGLSLCTGAGTRLQWPCLSPKGGTRCEVDAGGGTCLVTACQTVSTETLSMEDFDNRWLQKGHPKNSMGSNGTRSAQHVQVEANTRVNITLLWQSACLHMWMFWHKPFFFFLHNQGCPAIRNCLFLG